MSRPIAAPSGVRRARSERLEARISIEQKDLFQRAAELSGRNLTDFVIAAVQEAAAAEIERHAMLRLAADDSAAFVSALMTPSAPNSALRRAAKKHKSASA